MTTAQDILKTACTELGVKESPAYSNNVKYNTEYYGRTINSSAYAWCMVFVWWVFRHTNASKLFYDGGKIASCTTFMNWAKKTGRWVTSDYKPGDIILYNFNSDSYSEHVGICESYDGKYVTCIEGNTGSTSDADGGQVQRKKRIKGLVIGAYRPAYDTAPSATIGANVNGGYCKMILRVMKKGCTGADVKALQALLKGYGYDPKGVDGSFGTYTQAAVKKFQTAKKLEVDGIVGAITWGKLLGK